MPPLNMYVTQPVKVQTIENAVKVQCLQTGIVVLKTDESVERITKYASQTKAQKETIATGEMVDISGTNESDSITRIKWRKAILMETTAKAKPE